MKDTNETGTAGDLAPYAEGISTAHDRALLFDDVCAKILRRDAFVPGKLRDLGVDVHKELLRCRDLIISAQSDEALLYGLLKLSCARKDPHVRAYLIPDGLKMSGIGDVTEPTRIAQLPAEHAPIRFSVDHTPGQDMSIFVADIGGRTDAELQAYGVAPGDVLTAVNGVPFSDYMELVAPFSRYATKENLYWRVSKMIPQRTREYPPYFFRDSLYLELENANGQRYSVRLPYLAPDTTLVWTGTWKMHGDFRYPGFEKVLSTSSYDLYTRTDDVPVLLLDWYRFDDKLIENMQILLDYAEERKLFDFDVIFDATRARGGSLGAAAVRCLSPKPFRTTFGNLRISDIVEPFIEYMHQRSRDGLSMTAEDGGTWLLDWLDTDVRDALKRGDEYSGDVPFKSSHLPKDSDGIMQPEARHFRGRLVCLLGPHGGSHLDQVAAMFYDNDLAYMIGMPAGGYSNTWEWDEVLRFPESGKPVIGFMYSMGHTIRPNGELLEGNPAPVHTYIPQTRGNFIEYPNILLDEALSYLGSKENTK